MTTARLWSHENQTCAEPHGGTLYIRARGAGLVINWTMLIVHILLVQTAAALVVWLYELSVAFGEPNSSACCSHIPAMNVHYFKDNIEREL